MTGRAGGNRAARLALAAAAVVILAAGYILTVPVNHATALDSYAYAHFIRDAEIGATPQVRVYLWTVTMQVLHAAFGRMTGEADPFVTIGAVNAVLTALSVVLLKDLLTRRFRTSEWAAWLTALGFGASYGVWRYAAELEVYAASAVLSLALLHAALSIERGTAPVPRARIFGLAVAGGLATLFYQPIGLLAGIVLPAYLVMRVPLRAVIGYLAVAGIVLVGGLAYQAALVGPAVSTAGAQNLLDTSGRLLSPPGGGDYPRALVAILQNVVSVNWAYSFPASRTFIEETSGHAFRVYLHAAQFSGPGYLVFLVTLPLIGALGLVVLARARRAGRLPGPDAREGAVLLWLALHAAMVLLIHPASFEAWIPSLPPFFILLGLRLAEPLVRHGDRRIGIAALSALVVHNWFAGLGVLGGAERDYFETKGARLIATAERNDLVLVSEDWFYGKFLVYSLDAPVVFLPEADEAATRALVTGTLSRAGEVYLVDRSLRTQVIVADGSETAEAGTMGLSGDYRTEWAAFEDDRPIPGLEDAALLE